MKRYRVERTLGSDAKVSIEADSLQEIIQAIAEGELEKIPLFPSGKVETKPSMAYYESVQELLQKSSSRTDLSKTMIFSYWLWKTGTQNFNATDIDNVFRKSMERPPVNVNHLLNYLTRKGYLMEAGKKDDKKAWSITRLGVNLVEGELLRGEKND